MRWFRDGFDIENVIIIIVMLDINLSLALGVYRSFCRLGGRVLSRIRCRGCTIIQGIVLGSFT